MVASRHPKSTNVFPTRPSSWNHAIEHGHVWALTLSTINGGTADYSCNLVCTEINFVLLYAYRLGLFVECLVQYYHNMVEFSLERNLRDTLSTVASTSYLQSCSETRMCVYFPDRRLCRSTWRPHPWWRCWSQTCRRRTFFLHPL